MRTVHNPPNRFESSHLEWEPGYAPLAKLHIQEETAKSILSENRSPDLPFRFSVNPYRGCQHACAYCYARPSHAYWGYGAGTDFERRLIVKQNAPALLARALRRRSWQGHSIMFSGNTDCYQPIEGKYRLTRALLEVCLKYRNHVSIITKGSLIARDLDLLQALAQVTTVRVFMSIPFADDALGRALEPAAAPISRRFAVLEQLSAAGIETGVALAPLIPGVSEASIAPVLRAAHQAGARQAFAILLRLPGEVAEVFFARLQEALPMRAKAVESAQRQMRAGQLNSAAFGERMRGIGPRYQALLGIFAAETRRLGMETRCEAELLTAPPTPRNPNMGNAPGARRAASPVEREAGGARQVQLPLFDGLAG